MSKLKLLKYPKKPKKRASNDSKINWLAKVEEVKIENNRRIREREEGKKLDLKIAGIGKFSARKASPVHRKKRSTSHKKKRTTKRRR